MSRRTAIDVVANITTVPDSLVLFKGQARYFHKRGISMVYISSPGEKLKRFASDEEALVYGLTISRAITPIRDLFSLFRLVHRLFRLRPRIVHAHTPKGGLLGMISSSLVGGIIRIYNINGFPYMTATGLNRLLLMTSERLSCKLAHHVFCVSHSLREIAIADRICSPEKIKVLEGGSLNGVDVMWQFNPTNLPSGYAEKVRNDLNLPRRAKILLFVGRVVRDKGIEDLADAWRTLRVEFPDAYLLVVGPQETRDAVSAETIATLARDDRVILTGERNDPVPYFALADVVALPSYREGFPTVLLEASAMEKPIVTTAIPGCIDAVVDHETGTLVPTSDPEAIRSAVAQYFRNPQLREQHGKKGRERVIQLFRQEIVWEAILNEYRRFLDGVRGGVE